ncbi:SusD/RagB family nutrient-binding outer membrane lipoprotein [Algoriphagus boritolerans]|uniref:Starch-binding associating with outer membrane n=1 Tax=Algoriphagus boritolerans DSM 17298 = JCM 18970 TaxID=1120964 RepID=A0A1H5WJF0_9BACT|nr:SusD/RagB family nutrient-binding outer membrane lipoprotein [Algoriphagus boritolerans]SEF99622.1 Starch-binding associating with outer membrane [Algoriphagus boritolerans DSM 17298 = JCM 18970]
MKLFRYIKMALVFSIAYSCTGDFEEINTDPNRIDKISPGTLLNPILYGISSFNTDRADGFTFQIMQVALPFPSANGGLHRYDLTENSGNSTWNTYYRWLVNIREMKQAAIDAQDPNYEAIALTLEAWVGSQLTDSFGDVPFAEASKGEQGIFQAKFDTQEQIYAQIFENLERANSIYDPTRPMVFGEDILFGNQVSRWKKFTNSLHLRLLLRVSRVQESSFQKMAAMLGNPAQYPIFTNTDESAILNITGVVPNISPWGRAIDFTTFRAISEFFVDRLNELEDPRRMRFMTQARALDGTTTLGYRGIPSGYGGTESQFQFIPSNHNIALVQAPMISLILTYAELEFIQAELAQRGVINSDAQAHYENGVRAAMEQWDVVIPEDYFENPNAAYDETLERIILQKYIGLYFNDYQQWFEYRRTGFPVLPKQDGMLNDQRVPVRFRYPVNSQLNNPVNYQEAVARMGGDDINTKVWWEK